MKEKEKMLFLGFFQRIIFMILLFMPIFFNGVESLNRILLDTDVDTDDFLALLYILKLNRSEIDLKVLFSSSMSYFFILKCWNYSITIISHFYLLNYIMPWLLWVNDWFLYVLNNYFLCVESDNKTWT